MRGGRGRAGALRVAHVTTVDLSLRYLLLNQLRRIGEEGYEVFGVSAPGPDVAAVEEAGITHFSVPMTRRLTPFADVTALWFLLRVMRREQFDIVHTHTPKAGLLGQLAARLAGVPIVVNTLHGFYFHDDMGRWSRRFYIAMEKIAARCSDAILSQNREDIETALSEGIATKDQLVWLGNGIDLTRFDSNRVLADSQHALRDELALGDGPIVGFVGRLVEEKGILDLLEAACAVVERFPQARFLIVGPYDNDKADALRPEIADRFGLADHCRFTGLRHDMPEMYALMDLLVLPSYREGFPRAPMEASAMGVPCVVTDIRGCRETVEHEVNGVLYPSGDARALADAIIDLLANADRRRTLGLAGKRLARERFDERRVFARVLAEYDRLLARAAAQGSPKLEAAF